jgi:hypothetical protein
MQPTHTLMLFSLVLILGGCASSGGVNSESPRRQSSVITAEEMRERHYGNMYDLIQALRPQWLVAGRAQSVTDPSAGQVVVYMDGVRAGGTGFLRQIATADVQRAEWLSPTEASTRFGTGHTGGVIIVSTRR